MKRVYYPLLLTAMLCACTPSKRVSVSQSFTPLAPEAPVAVFSKEEPAPEGSAILGSVKMGDTGFTTSCSYAKVIEAAKQSAREIGGNALKITEHKLPSVWSTCHRITADIINIPEEAMLAKSRVSENRIDEALAAEGCVMLHFYRLNGIGPLIGYDIKIGDQPITRSTNNYRESVKIKGEGPITLVARTEAKEELQLDLKPGTHYYIRCSVSMGVMIGHPRLELVDTLSGKAEFDTIRDKD